MSEKIPQENEELLAFELDFHPLKEPYGKIACWEIILLVLRKYNKL